MSPSAARIFELRTSRIPWRLKAVVAKFFTSGLLYEFSSLASVSVEIWRLDPVELLLSGPLDREHEWKVDQMRRDLRDHAEEAWLEKWGNPGVWNRVA